MTDMPNNENQKKKILHRLIFFLKEIFSIKEGTDVTGAIELIKRDITFKGRSIWILIASIFIASVGLNQNSTAVVIGAMLISPLMGPILGVGLGIGTNDWILLKRSAKFFLTSLIVSIMASTIYFLITPLKELNSELFARTQPTLLDVLVAIFGGLAGIVVGSGNQKSNVVPGVAIATALMPPLCTAGYGIATWQLHYTAGALYLFFINSVFISLATFAGVKYLNFPVMNYVSPEKERKFRIYIIIFVLLMITPGAKIFWDVIKESTFNARVNQFEEENLHQYRHEIILSNRTYSDSVSYLNFYLGGYVLTDAQIKDFTDKLPAYGLTKDGAGFRVTDSTALIFHQGDNNIDTLTHRIQSMSREIHNKLRVGILEDIYKKQENLLEGKNARIDFLEKQLIDLKKDTIPLQNLQKEMQIQYPHIKRFAYSPSIEINDSARYDTIPTFLINWKKGTSAGQRRKDRKTLSAWLKIRLEMDTVRIVNY
ncbi:MAG: TIGR00341 family protein [Bacteroidia bacterium]|nr:MAG: TIGR00341 family protein [Bacteroidia bacterium]